MFAAPITIMEDDKFITSLIRFPSKYIFLGKEALTFFLHLHRKAGKGMRDLITLIVYLIEMPFNTFANRADPNQAALVRAA